MRESLDRATLLIKAQLQDIAKNLDPPVVIDCMDLDRVVAITAKEGEGKNTRYRFFQGHHSQ